MKKTQHLVVRQQQRSIPDKVLELVYVHGDYLGRDTIYMSRKKCLELLGDLQFRLKEAHRKVACEKSAVERHTASIDVAKLKREIRLLEKSGNVKLVEESGTIVTCMKPSGRGLRSVRRKLKRENLH